MRIASLLTILALSSFAGAAELPADWYYGRPLELPDARAVALGGVTAVIGAPFGFMANPGLTVLGIDRQAAALAPGTVVRPSAGLSYLLGLVSEQRTRTIYDSYNNAVGELAIADNFEADALPGPIALTLPIKFIHVGAGLVPRYDFNYDFRQELKDDFYQHIAYNDVQISGQVMRANVAVAYDLLNIVGIGVGAGYDFGERTLRRRDTLTGDTWQVTNRGTPAGVSCNAGLLLHLGQVFRAGLTVEPGGKYSKWENGLSYTDPMRAKLGVSYLAPGRVPAAIMGQVSYTDWHATNDSLSRTLEFRGGIEHRLLNNVSLRYGFGLLPSPRDPAVQTGLVSLGFGFDSDFAHFDLAGSFQRRVFGASLLTPQPDVETKIYETNGEVVLSISRGF